MSIIQHNNELRYIRRQNLHEEARIMRNYYRDIIRSYGIDCNYYKIKIPYPEEFRRDIDHNNLILHAYGYDVNPDYSISANMITYMEVENDIFQLNKFGIIPNTDVNFYFDSVEFAASLAYKLGKYKEFKLKTVSVDIDLTEEQYKYIISNSISLPFECSCCFQNKCSIMSGSVSIPLLSTEGKLSVDYKVEATPISVDYSFPVNKDIYKSFNYNVPYDSIDGHMIDFSFRTEEKERISAISSLSSYEELLSSNLSSSISGVLSDETVILSNLVSCYNFIGTLDGNILFHDLHKIGKYMEYIMPAVGDIITIDFPNAESREQYEITDCEDKNLANDGLNPLMHKYIWKCKARRYINSQEEFPEENFANEKLEEKLDLQETAFEEVAKDISIYDDNEDDVYGGYNRPQKFRDIKIYHINPNEIKREYDLFDNSYRSDIIIFNDNNRIDTDGYNLYFTLSGDLLSSTQITFIPKYYTKISTVVSSVISTVISNNVSINKEVDVSYNVSTILSTGISSISEGLNNDMQFIRATDDFLDFINIDNEIYRLCDSHAPDFALSVDRLKQKIVSADDNGETPINEFLSDDSNQICLDSLDHISLSDNQHFYFNFDGNSFYKFPNCKTILYSANNKLYCNMGNKKIPTIVLA